MLGLLIRKMQKKELISALRVRMVLKRNIVRFGTRIVNKHIFINMQLICTEARYERYIVRDAK